MKKALITGITGQDGSYLSELLLHKGYEVWGLVRRVTFEDKVHRLSRISHLLNKIHLVSGSLESYPSLFRALKDIQPDEVYHLAAQSFVDYSFEDEFSTLNTNINGTHGLLAACQELAPDARFYFAGTSEMFGNTKQVPQSEETSFRPRSAYGISKVAGFHLTRNYRENYGMFACSGIMYNHESPRRGFEFVTRKISSSVAKIHLGLLDRLELGNLDALRDWGDAREYVEAMWLMLQQDEPRDYVIATGKARSVKDFCEIAFRHVDLDYRDSVVIKQDLFRKEQSTLIGDPSQAKKLLSWVPQVNFNDLVAEMVDNDIQLLSR